MGSTAALVLALLTPAPVCAGSSGPLVPADTFEDTYKAGVTFDQFLERATRRKEMWERHYQEGRVDSEARARAQALSGTWRILAIAEDWCSDSVNTLPYLALLAESAPGIELRVVNSEVGADIMEAHPTPDGRPSTPTVLVLNEAYEEVGCWVERPSELQRWAMENRESLGDEFVPQKMAWYREDAGRSTIDEVLTVIEAATRSETICAKG